MLTVTEAADQLGLAASTLRREVERHLTPFTPPAAGDLPRRCYPLEPIALDLEAAARHSARKPTPWLSTSRHDAMAS